MEIRLLNKNEDYPMSLLLSADPSKEVIEDYIERGECFIAVEGNQIIGVYVILPTRPKTVELVNIAVTEELHGKGTGKSLIKHAIESAKQRGYETIEVGTGNSSIGQLVLYQKCGFRITGVDNDFFTTHYKEKIFENGIHCKDMIRLSQSL